MFSQLLVRRPIIWVIGPFVLFVWILFSISHSSVPGRFHTLGRTKLGSAFQDIRNSTLGVRRLRPPTFAVPELTGF